MVGLEMVPPLGALRNTVECTELHRLYLELSIYIFSICVLLSITTIKSQIPPCSTQAYHEWYAYHKLKKIMTEMFSQSTASGRAFEQDIGI